MTDKGRYAELELAYQALVDTNGDIERVIAFKEKRLEALLVAIQVYQGKKDEDMRYLESIRYDIGTFFENSFSYLVRSEPVSYLTEKSKTKLSKPSVNTDEDILEQKIENWNSELNDLF
eukprot:TRINITY_DN1818_c0_g1_i1.p1 TRINITY_DN1818_c0_g1~~TRINITY_DN1818_c0_g1_i1.p1  ORF type:complete len:119 (-),score=35.66 TRINITY_DN1818_c0_g1_i1:246-602(-)